MAHKTRCMESEEKALLSFFLTHMLLHLNDIGVFVASEYEVCGVRPIKIKYKTGKTNKRHPMLPENPTMTESD